MANGVTGCRFCGCVSFTTLIAKRRRQAPLSRRPVLKGLIVRLLTWSTTVSNLIDGAGPVGKIICVIAVAFAVFSFVPDDASADGMKVKVKPPARRVVADTSVIRPACPDPYSCSPLYGAYGPYGGAAFLTRYTYSGWYR
jgi:hypothetical protein